MHSWVEGFQQSIDFIEENLISSLEIEEIAQIAALSPFYYQRIFGALCGMTVGEYIRARRMTLTAQEFSGTDGKVIDVTLNMDITLQIALQRCSRSFMASLLREHERKVLRFGLLPHCISKYHWRMENCWITAS